MLLVIGILIGLIFGMLIRGVGFRRRFVKGLVRARLEGLETGKTYGYRCGYDEAMEQLDCNKPELRAQ